LVTDTGWGAELFPCPWSLQDVGRAGRLGVCGEPVPLWRAQMGTPGVRGGAGAASSGAGFAGVVGMAGLVPIRPGDWARQAAPSNLTPVHRGDSGGWDRATLVGTRGPVPQPGGCTGPSLPSFIFSVSTRGVEGCVGPRVCDSREGEVSGALVLAAEGSVAKVSGSAPSRDAVGEAVRSVSDYVAGLPRVQLLQEQPTIPCPDCGGKLGVVGSVTNPLDFRYRCGECAWVWCDWGLTSAGQVPAP
jgi:hypothetical protein